MKKGSTILISIIIIGTLYFMITAFDSSRILTYLAVIPILLVPLLLKKTKYRLNDKELFYYYLFIFFADFTGCVGNLYNITSWYDTFIHFYSGIFSCKIGLFLLEKMQAQQNQKSFQMIFCISIIMLIAGTWEIFEFTADQILNMNLQHQLETGVVDTMLDMIAAFTGGIIGIIAYSFKIKFGKKSKL